MFSEIKENKGFTLIELLIVIALLAVTSRVTFEVYYAQKKSQEINEEIVGIQQNIRAAFSYLEQDIKLAGLDPSRIAGSSAGAKAGIVFADINRIQFTFDNGGGEEDGIDNDKDGAIDEEGEWFDGIIDNTTDNITFFLYDSGSDGDMDLGRLENGGVTQPVSDNIDVFDIVYLTSGGAVIGPTPLSSNDMKRVACVEITLVARAEKVDLDYTDTQAYLNRQGTEILPAQNDHYRRISMSTAIKLRNIVL